MKCDVYMRYMKLPKDGELSKCGVVKIAEIFGKDLHFNIGDIIHLTASQMYDYMEPVSVVVDEIEYSFEYNDERVLVPKLFLGVRPKSTVTCRTVTGDDLELPCIYLSEKSVISTFCKNDLLVKKNGLLGVVKNDR